MAYIVFVRSLNGLPLITQLVIGEKAITTREGEGGKGKTTARVLKLMEAVGGNKVFWSLVVRNACVPSTILVVAF